MTRNMTKIWLLGPGSGFRGQKCDKNMRIIWINCENNVNLANHIIFTFFHIIFILFSHFFTLFLYFYDIFGPGTQIRAPKVIFLSYSWSYFSYYFHIFVNTSFSSVSIRTIFTTWTYTFCVFTKLVDLLGLSHNICLWVAFCVPSVCFKSFRIW